MLGKHGLVFVSLLVLAMSGCKEPNPYRCPDGEKCDPDAREGEQCGDIKCKAPMPVCDTSTTTCVECLEEGDCSAARPVCSAQHECVECITHDDCMESKLCLVDKNTCAASGDVTYVGGPNASTANKSCLIDAPCADLKDALAPAGLRRYIKVTGLVTSGGTADINNKKAIIYGDQGVLASSYSGRVIYIHGTSEVTLIDLDIQGNAGTGSENCVDIATTSSVVMTRVNVHNHALAGIGMDMIPKLVMIDSKVYDNTLEGVKVAGGTLEIHHSSIYGNKGGVITNSAMMVTIDSSTISGNTGTNGVSITTGPFVIRNSIIARNGGGNSTTGGLALSSTNGVVDFCTISNNVSDIGGNAGVSCAGSVNITNSILTNNNSTVPIGSTCNVTYSLWTTLPAPPGTGNITGDPMFLNTTDRLDPGFFRIKSASDARNKVSLGLPSPANVTDDIDGQPRDDGLRDMGADEYK